MNVFKTKHNYDDAYLMACDWTGPDELRLTIELSAYYNQCVSAVLFFQNVTNQQDAKAALAMLEEDARQHRQAPGLTTLSGLLRPARGVYEVCFDITYIRIECRSIDEI